MWSHFCTLQYPFWRVDWRYQCVPLHQPLARTPCLSWGKESIWPSNVFICGQQVIQGSRRKEDAWRKSHSNQGVCLATFNMAALTSQINKRCASLEWHCPRGSGVLWVGGAAAWLPSFLRISNWESEDLNCSQMHFSPLLTFFFFYHLNFPGLPGSTAGVPMWFLPGSTPTFRERGLRRCPSTFQSLSPGHQRVSGRGWALWNRGLSPPPPLPASLPPSTPPLFPLLYIELSVQSKAISGSCLDGILSPIKAAEPFLGPASGVCQNFNSCSFSRPLSPPRSCSAQRVSCQGPVWAGVSLLAWQLGSWFANEVRLEPALSSIRLIPWWAKALESNYVSLHPGDTDDRWWDRWQAV